MPSLVVLVSHTGKSLQLSCSAATRVEAVQQALVPLTGVPLADQIVMCRGAPLDPTKPLSAYALPLDEHDQPHDVFLYNRALLKPGAPPPPEEAAPVIEPATSAAPIARELPHSLDTAASPLLRALPEYERQFRRHLEQARALAETAQLRYAACVQLVGEQEVQALSVDAARSNVEAHYAYIRAALEGFMQRHQQQHALHADVLGSFEDDLQFLAATELHPALRREGCTRLADLVDVRRLRELRAAAAKSHTHFAAKVSELESLFSLLRGDVEALLLQAPSVDLDALGARLAAGQERVDEQAAVMEALCSDLAKARQALEQTAAQLGAADSTAPLTTAVPNQLLLLQLPDTCQMLESMHHSHVDHLLPRLTACDAELAALTADCVACKNALTRGTLGQLQRIASQQSRIRDMRNKLVVFGQALARQEDVMGELLALRRVPAAYKHCLAECVRRAAFAERYAQSAERLAESMGRFREKEVATRQAFVRHVESYVPASLLERMGLLEQPAHCQVTLPTNAGGEGLMRVTVEEMQRFQLPWSSSSVSGLGPPPRPAPALDEEQGGAEHAAAIAAGTFGEGTASLQVENAKLRAELAASVALGCIRAAQQAEQLRAPPPSEAAPRMLPSNSGPASSAPGGQGSGEGGSEASSSAAARGHGPLALPEGYVLQFEQALEAKEAVARALQVQLTEAWAQAAAYKQRILSLEAQLGAWADPSASGGVSSAPQQAVGSLPPAATDIAPCPPAYAGCPEAAVPQEGAAGSQSTTPGGARQVGCVPQGAASASSAACQGSPHGPPAGEEAVVASAEAVPASSTADAETPLADALAGLAVGGAAGEPSTLSASCQEDPGIGGGQSTASHGSQQQERPADEASR